MKTIYIYLTRNRLLLLYVSNVYNNELLLDIPQVGKILDWLKNKPN